MIAARRLRRVSSVVGPVLKWFSALVLVPAAVALYCFSSLACRLAVFRSTGDWAWIRDPVPAAAPTMSSRQTSASRRALEGFVERVEIENEQSTTISSAY